MKFGEAMKHGRGKVDSSHGSGLAGGLNVSGLGAPTSAALFGSRKIRAGKFIRFSRVELPSQLTASDRTILRDTIRMAVVPQLVSRMMPEQQVEDLSHEGIVEIDLDGLARLLLDRSQESFELFRQEMDVLRDAPAVVFDKFVRTVLGRVGEMWTQDNAGFYEVTLASARLQAVIREKIMQARSAPKTAPASRRILLAKVSGEEHTLGLMVVTACFQEAGWEVSGGAELACGTQMFKTLSEAPFSILGLSVSVSVDEAKLAKIIRKAKSVSANRNLGICLGGPAVMADNRRFDQLDVDFIALDALSAVRHAEERLAS